MRSNRHGIFVGILALFAAMPALAQSQPGPQEPAPVASPTPGASPQQLPRPKIGVALEGGGALGLAHIGVLRWLEEHHVPIDYIAGTSMGGLVGGLYASGKSPDELQKIVEAQDWDIIIGGRTPYEDLSFRRKEDQTAYPNSLILGLKHGIALPAGLNAGQKISLLIDRETLPYAGIKTFNDLPIPFRCVATDLVSGKEVVFSEGRLSTALRATMSIPGIFSPVREGEHVYVDGGLVGNLPTDVVRQMGADIVIGVHLETAPAKADEINSLFSVLGRSIDVVIRENEIRGLAGADLIVKVGLSEYTSMDYQKSAAIISKGHQAAEEKSRVLLPYSLDNSDWTAYVDHRLSRERIAPDVPQFVRVEGVSGEAQRGFMQYLQPLIGKPLDAKKMDTLLTRLTGIGKYDTATYSLIQENGQTGLLVSLQEKNYGPPLLQPGFEVDGSETNDVTFTMGARLTFMDIAGYRSEWRTDVEFGNTYGIASELYRPFTPLSKWFFAPRAIAYDEAFKIYQKSNPLADYRIAREDIGMDIGYGFSRFTELRVGYSYGYTNAVLKLGLPEFPAFSGNVGDTHLHFLMDHTDDPVVPRRGYLAETTFHWYNMYPGYKDPFAAMDAQLEYFVALTRRGSGYAIASGGTTFGTGNTGSVPLYFLGGPNHLSAYGTNELYGDQFYLGRIGYLHEILTLPPFVGKKVYATGFYEFGKMYGFPLQSRFPNDFAAGLVAETAVGPLFIGGAAGDTGHYKWFFQLGKVF